MPLMIEGKPIGGVPKTVQEFLDKYDFKDSSNKLKSGPLKKVAPIGLLYVGQREFAATSPEDEKILVMGSEDATTCHIVIIRHTGCGAVCIAHFDGYGSDKAVKDIMRVMNDLCKNKPFGRYELHIAGGFKDDDESSEKVSIKTLSNDNIHRISTNGPHELKILLTDWQGVTKYVVRQGFYMDDEQKQYRIYSSHYSGNAGVTIPFNIPFSTFDVNNSTCADHLNCAVSHHGAWWYTCCYYSNLNGKYYHGNHSSYADGVAWLPFHGNSYSLKKTTMMIRKV
ncbi:protein N-terminal asparagine amidohydrolase [Mytilus galloprovincialis]|uniref:Protein N-terminal asparagine amidohydrolase n=1 Tax=Mytilus galloprovincialis TaxID=29158 RepID=A0A8B6F376_MYTGA|nr:protein N-terminal asparagine amidohydrolase [Mytilus galloprovincialis]